MLAENRQLAVVIGGGIGGLATATMLARAGWSVTLVERAARPGGRARSREHQGWIFNQGAHALYRGGPAEQVLRELGVPLSGRVPRVRGFAQWRDRLYRFPSGPATMLTSRMLSPPARLEVLGLLARMRRPGAAALASVDVAAWLSDLLRDPVARAFAAALVRVVTYSGAPERISAQVAQDALYQGLVRGVLYLDGGWQSIVDRLVQSAYEVGVTVHCAATVAAIDAGTQVRGVVLADGRRLPAQAVVLAADPAVARELLAPLLPASGPLWPQLIPLQVATLDVALRRLPRPGATFALGVDRPLYLSVHSAAARLAPQGAALLHVMKYHDPHNSGDAVADRAELERLLDRVQPGWHDELADVRFVPHLTVAHNRLDAENGGYGGRPGVALPGVPGLALVGDWVGRTGQLADAVLASAGEAARRIIAAGSYAHAEPVPA